MAHGLRARAEIDRGLPGGGDSKELPRVNKAKVAFELLGERMVFQPVKNRDEDILGRGNFTDPSMWL